MAQPIEIAFCRVWDRKSVKRLKAAELGAYMALSHAVLVQGFDPLPTDRDTLQLLSRASRIQWARGGDRILEALCDTMSVLRQSYSKHLAVREIRKANALSLHDKMKLAKRADHFVQQEAHEFVSQGESLSGIIQPFQATKYIPKDYDKAQRDKAIASTAAVKGKDRPLKD